MIFNMKKKILVAMSGGVDSSTAAFILKEEGFEVIGATLKLWRSNDDKRRPGGCCSSDDIQDARRVCNHLGIKHYVLNFEEEFKDIVVDDFVSSYLSGKTPNPCIVCNEKIKFNKLLKKTQTLGFDLLATGHYAIIEKSADGYLLKKGLDAAKDQSYVLYRLGQNELSRLIFPLGVYTKKEIRKMAIKAGLPAADKPESQEICFVEKDYGSFINSYVSDAAKKVKPGPIIGADGKVLGKHKGIIFYTIGQRSGLGLSLPEPVYVTSIDPENNIIFVGSREASFSIKAVVEGLCWVSGKEPKFPLKCFTKIRRLHPEAGSVLKKSGETVLVSFKTAQHAVTPGQSAVFYDNDTVLGGGIISN
jgi:tRNA-specific 2-thiouridylase